MGPPFTFIIEIVLRRVVVYPPLGIEKKKKREERKKGEIYWFITKLVLMYNEDSESSTTAIHLEVARTSCTAQCGEYYMLNVTIS